MSRVLKEPRLARLFEWAMAVGRRVKEAEWAGRRAPVAARLQYAVARRLVFRKVLDRFGGRLRFTISGGAPLARKIAEFFDIVGLPLLNGYGLTESAPVIAVNRLESNRLGSVGQAPPGVEIRIAPDGGKNVAPQPIESQLVTSPYIAQAVAIGDNFPYITALITPNIENLRAYFEEHKVGDGGADGIAAHPTTEALIAQAVKDLNTQLPSYERIRRFTVLPNEVTIEAGEITPSLKLKRKVIAQRYQREIEDMYLKTHRTTGYGLD